MYNLNLMPWRTQRFKKIILLAGLANLLCWALCLGAYVVYKNQLNLSAKEQALHHNDNQIAAIKQEIASLQNLNNTKITFEKVQGSNQALLDTLVQISQIIPPNVRLDAIDMTPDTLTLIGQASNQREMTAFSQQVFNLPYFNRQKSWSISEGASDVNFKLVLKHENENTDSV